MLSSNNRHINKQIGDTALRLDFYLGISSSALKNCKAFREKLPPVPELEFDLGVSPSFRESNPLGGSEDQSSMAPWLEVEAGHKRTAPQDFDLKPIHDSS